MHRMAYTRTGSLQKRIGSWVLRRLFCLSREQPWRFTNEKWEAMASPKSRNSRVRSQCGSCKTHFRSFSRRGIRRIGHSRWQGISRQAGRAQMTQLGFACMDFGPLWLEESGWRQKPINALKSLLSFLSPFFFFLPDVSLVFPFLTIFFVILLSWTKNKYWVRASFFIFYIAFFKCSEIF